MQDMDDYDRRYINGGKPIDIRPGKVSHTEWPEGTFAYGDVAFGFRGTRDNKPIDTGQPLWFPEPETAQPTPLPPMTADELREFQMEFDAEIAQRQAPEPDRWPHGTGVAFVVLIGIVLWTLFGTWLTS